MAGCLWAVVSSRLREIYKVLEEVKELNLDLNLPQLVAIGDESSGKSSVLERLARVHFFPRSETICTRMPLELRLNYVDEQEFEKLRQRENLPYSGAVFCFDSLEPSGGRTFCAHENEISANLKTRMDALVRRQHGKLVGVVHDPVKIDVYSPHVPNLTVVDLPGIVTAHHPEEPPTMMEDTRALATKFLKMPHTLVLLIHPANASLRSSQALNLVQRFGNLDHCIGVLTKADLATETHIPGRMPLQSLQDKLDGKSGDYIPLPKGYITVCNADTRHPDHDLYNFVAVEAGECDFFEKLLAGYREKGKAGVPTLITRITDMMITYVAKTWKPSALDSITKAKAAAKEGLAKLGCDPEEIGKSAVQKIELRIGQEIKSVLKTSETWKAICDAMRNVLAGSELQFSWQSNGFNYYNLGEQFLEESTRWLNREEILRHKTRQCLVQAIRVLVEMIIKKVASLSDLPYRLERFLVLHSTLSDQLQSFLDQWMKEKDHFLQSLLDQFFIQAVIQHLTDLRSLENVVMHVLAFFMAALVHWKPKFPPKSHYDLLQEKAEFSSRRQKLLQRLDQLARASELISSRLLSS